MTSCFYTRGEAAENTCVLCLCHNTSTIQHSTSPTTRIKNSGWINLKLDCKYVRLVGRDELPKHLSPQAKLLFPRVVMLTFCTYFFLQHSSDISYQYSSNSVYKQRNLAKVLLLSLPGGYLVYVGDLAAADSRAMDSTLLEHALATIHADNWFSKGDQVMGDSGFSGTLLPSNVDLIVPSTLGSQFQLETDPANTNRAISEVRFAIEAANRGVKEFKLLSNVIDVKSITHLHQFVLLAAPLFNHWHLQNSDSQL